MCSLQLHTVICFCVHFLPFGPVTGSVMYVVYVQLYSTLLAQDKFPLGQQSLSYLILSDLILILLHEKKLLCFVLFCFWTENFLQVTLLVMCVYTCCILIMFKL